MATRADWQAYIDLAKSFDIIEVAKTLGCDLKKVASAEWACPCPIDGGRDRFSVSARKQVYNCRGAMDGGGDVIKMVMHCTGCNFQEACEKITNQPRPDRSRDETMEQRSARMKDNAVRMEAARQKQEQDRELERSKLARDETAVSRIIDRATPIEGTLAEAYIRGRGLTPSKRLMVDLRFVAELDYWGLADNGSSEIRHLMSSPALVAIIRNVYGDIIGLAQTYLDPKEPRKLRPPGSVRNSAKKVRGQKKGGMIRLGRMTETLAIGEGWENPLAWHQLGGGLHIEDLSMAAAVDLGNLSGGSIGKVAHPTATDPEGARLRIPSGVPDIDAPGVIIPDGVKSIILICDANSDGPRTAGHYLTAGARFEHHGMSVGLAWPLAGYDWNDILIREQAAVPA